MTFGDIESHFYWHRFAEVVTARDATIAVSTILDRVTKEAQGTHRRNSEDDRKTQLGGRGKGSKLIEGCIKSCGMKSLAHARVLPKHYKLSTQKKLHHQ